MVPLRPGNEMIQISGSQGHYGPVPDPHLGLDLREGQVVVRLARHHQDHRESTIIGITMSLIGGSPVDHPELIVPWLPWRREGLTPWLLPQPLRQSDVSEYTMSAKILSKHQKLRSKRCMPYLSLKAKSSDEAASLARPIVFITPPFTSSSFIS
jgi:hypothetical protein